MDIDGGFLLVAIACLLATVLVTADAAVALEVVPPLGLGRIVRLRPSEMSTGGKWVTLIAGGLVAAIAQLLVVSGLADASETRNLQRVAITAAELASASVWLAMVLRGFHRRSGV